MPSPSPHMSNVLFLTGQNQKALVARDVDRHSALDQRPVKHWPSQTGQCQKALAARDVDKHSALDQQLVKQLPRDWNTVFKPWTHEQQLGHSTNRKQERVVSDTPQQ
jgi:hypothetical protein